jgi:outer membrane protein OmpA-like peptidoglycan-associated protein
MRHNQPGFVVIGSMLALAGCAQPEVMPPNRSVVFFQQDGITLDRPALQVIHQMARTAKANPTYTVNVTAFGGTALDPAKAPLGSLSARRADVVSRALIKDGVQPGRIRTATHEVDVAKLPVEERRVEIDVDSSVPQK